MVKKSSIVFLTALFAVHLVYGQKCECFDFEWKGDSVSGRFIQKLAINVPVVIDNLPYKFDMQFDLGAVTTVLYGNSIKPYLELHSDFKNKIDSTQTFYIQSQKNIMFKNIDLKLGKVHFKNRNIGLFSEFGDSLTIESVKTDTSKHIGTIAADLFQDKVIIINFPKTKICISDVIPSKYKKLSYQNFNLEHGRIKIPLNINNKDELLMFDTGSSIFPLITTKHNADKISSESISDSLRITSWGEYYTIYGKVVNKKVKFANKKLPNSMVYYIDDSSFDDFYKKEKMWGMTGNAYFMDSIIVIDYKNKKIALK